MNNITVQCPACNQLAEHSYHAMQDGLPVRDKDGNLIKDARGNYVTKSIELWNCLICKSTWGKE